MLSKLQLSLNNHFFQLLEAKVFKLLTESKIKAHSSVGWERGKERKAARRLGKENQIYLKNEVVIFFPWRWPNLSSMLKFGGY